MINLESFKKKAADKSVENKKFLLNLKKKDPRKVDDAFHQMHDEVFEEIDCLTCANCCKTTSPIFYQRDVDRASKGLRMKPGDFIEKYLKVDEDNDLVLKQSPCAFLMPDNYCAIYEDRPLACREYPHTNRKKMQQIMDLTFRNTLVCPAVLRITNKIKSQLGL